MFTLLSQLMVTERFRAKAADIGTAIPLISTQEGLTPDCEPLLVTNQIGNLLKSTVSRKGGHGRFAYFECELGDEHWLLGRTHHLLKKNYGAASSWFEAKDRMVSMGLEPKVLVVGKGSTLVTLAEFPVLQIEALKPNQGILLAQPSDVGYYTRIRDHIGVMFTKVDRSMVAVESV